MSGWQALLERIEFKGVKLDYWHDSMRGDDRLMITATVEDTYHPGRMVKVGSPHFLPPYPTEEQYAIDIVRHAVRTWWLHEFDGLFKVDGSIYDDPHKRGQA